ncbi:MAG: 1-acyl-sn-glycerol-3-phosphate acyltransferase [Flavobacteriales bacterium]|nr:1-acyl-sn-glycerol-3-phosphate acyltransferase [Flavobacteriales bacterium]MCW8913644.1 1-acyl-sn-glycerol-3-phosphate acyltransferase [Flavobacteriales bacterium]MCW8937148.1 1-acyl-sn-glycerol-3-phosphate acyltransferase [Flavobacteriales bacterium]MCW8941178.1 1-acyl-sn-glycerol-3-phosphate acyltransferase [Flavobacteriales bacterium]MCW8968658.1 1-acyl-sn-glycerol-3-phosphate acyltransferase [Flavobacteriales bacterium]
MEQQLIDVEGIIANKNPKVLKWLPGFVISYLKRTIHQEDINTILIENKDKFDYEFAEDIIHRFNIKVKIKGIENVPKSGGCILASNHPLGGVDALAIVTALKDYRKDVQFVVNDILLHLKNLNGLFVGVNKHGSNSKQSLNSVNELFSSDRAVFVFPAGLVSRKTNGKIRDLEWKKTFITQAKRHQKDVIPIHVDGKLSKFFYRLANFRKFLGIKANIEMLFLAKETFKQKNKTITITFGKPISYTKFHKDKPDKYWAEWVKKKVYELKD